MRFFGFLIFVFFLLPLTVQAVTVDLSIEQRSISFSEEKLITGDTIRIYAAVKNVGEVDVSGYVLFYQGDLPVGNSQVISLRSDGSPEEVYVDFVVPTGSFNIRAEIRGTDPEDENSTNNVAITKLLTPILDDDRDGVENADDNCSSAENPDQADVDVDDLGDICDDDDDDDGVTDEVEEEIGTDPQKSDSDGDGLVDAGDPHPTVPESEVVLEQSTVEVSEVSEELPLASDISSENEEGSNVEVRPSEEIDDSSDEIPAVVIETKSESGLVSLETKIFSPKTIFTFENLNWNTYHFETQMPTSNDFRITWDFGDGVTSAKSEVDHTFLLGSGDYTVKASIENHDGLLAEDSVVIHVPFFSLANRSVQLLLGLLVLFLLIVLQLFFRAGRRTRIFEKKIEPSKAKKIIVRQVDD